MKTWNRESRPWGAPAAILLGALFLFASSGCALFYSNPQVRVLEVGVGSLGLTSGTADLRVEVRNPNRFGVELRGLRYRLDLGSDADEGVWVPLVTGTVSDTVRIRGRQVEVVSMSLPFQYSALGPVLGLALTGGAFRYRVVGDLTARGPLGQVELPFETRGRLDGWISDG